MGYQPAALTTARILAATSLALLAAGAALMLAYGVVLVLGPDDGETTYVHTEAVLPALASVVVSSCIAIWGLGRAVPRTVLAGAGGVAVASAILMVAAEDVNSSLYIESEYIHFYRAVFVLVLALVVAVALVGWRLRTAARDA